MRLVNFADLNLVNFHRSRFRDCFRCLYLRDTSIMIIYRTKQRHVKISDGLEEIQFYLYFLLPWSCCCLFYTNM